MIIDDDVALVRDFILYDKDAIVALYPSLLFALRGIGKALRNKQREMWALYKSESDPIYELLELLDGNNFIVEYNNVVCDQLAAKLIPLYPEETIEVSCTYTATTYTEYAECAEYVPELPEVRNPPRRGLRAKTLLIDDISFNEKLFDEFLKPP